MSKNKQELPVFIGEPTEDDISGSSVEVKSSEKLVSDLCPQMIAETIVFLFLQNKQNAGKLRNNLIPGIGIINEKLIVFMYDCENDVLLGSRAMDLFEDEDVYIRIILVLWLVLNYKLFGTGLIDEIKNYKANFHSLLGNENLERYKTEVAMPFHKKHSQKRTFDPNISSIP
ncbi:uncharacterized protein LOC132755535 [Ruditapes philippinarum]|uniref:uncharacterized protein LOC132755535 n=1 Tax=Ruditapes philippinarum TaxID=129788 RepID=UPI00295B3EAB|nr:uncharacterized protein LOC132755535 [Ruditapes philippinarum]